ncbi:MAG: hypothetical protein JW991_00415 [Candidatus Pacebacteria bacterium]|nr:hypothetical protein [Candidatus Paceibacterota bacterium]
MDKRLVILAGLVLLLVAGGILILSEKLAGSSSSKLSLDTSDNPSELKSEGFVLSESTGSVKDESYLDEDLIGRILGAKYHQPVAEVRLMITQKEGNFAQGLVGFENDPGGGIWLAWFDGKTWQVIFDGSGAIFCSAVDPYNFPAKMVPDCWDDSVSGWRLRED